MNESKIRIIFLLVIISLLSTSCSHVTPDDFLSEGDKFYAKRKYTQAIEQYNKAIAKKRDFTKAYLNKGLALESLGKLKEAVGNYTDLLTIAPGQSKALMRRGTCYVKLNQYSNGLPDLKQADSIAPNDPFTLSTLGFCKIRVYDSSGMKDLNRAILLDPKNYLLVYNRGFAKYAMQKYSEAEYDFERSAKMNTGFGEAYYRIGLCKDHLGKQEEACEFWLMALKNGYIEAQARIDKDCK
jgi:tetratricopeptide (TPR) repeat protein